MRYLTIAADYTASSLRDDFGGPLEPEELDLPPDLCNALREWSDRYQKIIPLREEVRRRSDVAELIKSLDEEGQDLTARIAAILGPSGKVRYYSEGRLAYL